jgi:alpha-galactosidase
MMTTTKENKDMGVKIVLIGAGSSQFGYDTMGDIFQSQILPGGHIALHDINPEALEGVFKNGQRFIKEKNLPYTISATTDRKEALKDADFCIISIEVGNRFKLWELDWRIPQQFGFQQVMGENGGPGGLFHALRIIPPILAICEDIQATCPHAVVINYSNPMTKICTTVHRKYPNLQFVGLCHEIESLAHHLPLILNTPFENLDLRSGGLNHFSILLEARYKQDGRDAYPDIREKAPVYFENLASLRDVIRELKSIEAGSTPMSEPALRTNAGKWAERGIFKVLLEEYGYLPITTDSHLGEYVSWAKDVSDHKGILDFYHYYREWLDKDPQIEIKLHERVVPIIEGILTDSGYEEAAVNLPNAGYIDALPGFLAVEVPAIVSRNGVQGICFAQFPKGFASLLSNQVGVNDLIADAVINGSRDCALQALLADPVVDKYHAARRMLDYMLEVQEEHLGYLK